MRHPVHRLSGRFRGDVPGRSRWALLVVLLALLAAFPSLLALDPQRSIRQYGLDRWSYQRGLPGSAVNDIYQSQEGYLWINSGGLLFRFDGVRFVQIPLVVNGQPLHEGIRSVCKGRGNAFLLRTMSHLLRFSGGRFQPLSTTFRLPVGNETVMCEGQDGTVWIGSENHVYRLQNGLLEPVIANCGWVRAMVEDPGGNLWIAGSAALYRVNQGVITRFSPRHTWVRERFFLPQRPPSIAEASSRPTREVTALLVDRSGTTWIASVGGLFKYRQGTFLQDGDCNGLQTQVVTVLQEDRDGNIWAGTDGQGLFRLCRGQWSRLSTQEGLSDDSILSLLEDREGSLWVGTMAGLDRLRNTPFVTITTKEGLSSNHPSAVLEGRDGRLYVFTQGGGITCFKDGKASVFTTRNGLTRDFAGNLFEARDGSVWVGMNQGIARFQNGRIQTFTAGGRLSNLYVSAICEDDKSLILACSDLNMYRFIHDRLSPYDLKLSPSRDPEGNTRYAFTAHRDPDGVLWFGLSAGLYRVGPGEGPEKAVRTAFTELTQTISDDGRGYLWVTGRNTPGFSRLSKQDGSLVRYAPEAGVLSTAVARILADSRGDLWAATNDGIHHYRRSELDAFAEGRIRTLHPVKYGIIDGLQSEDCSERGREPSGWRGRDGRLYFASRKGLAMLDPDHLSKNLEPPAVHIEDVLQDDAPLSLDGPVVLAPGRQNLEIRYSATSFLVPSRVRFRYYLEGFSKEWIDAGDRRTAFFTKLPPGQYRFRVIACNNDGVWNESGAALAFRILPRFYQTWWFRSLGVLFIGGLILSAHLVRTRHMRKRQQELVALVDAQTRTLKEEIEDKAEAQEALIRYRDHLEHLVAERTATLQTTFEQLRQSQKLEAIGQLAGGVAHDFNNLITVILGCSTIVVNELEASDDVKAMVGEIQFATERAAALTRQLLAFSRRQVLQPEELDLASVLIPMEKMLRRLIGEHIHFQLCLPNEPVYVRADPAQLEQVILNLVLNARDAMPRGGALTLEIRRTRQESRVTLLGMDLQPGEYACLAVRDTGFGMSPETKVRIFEPFFTTKGIGKGTGLGLSTVYGIVQQSGGGIEVESVEGQGSEFQIYLPRIQPTGDERAAEIPSGAILRGSERILLVEDSEGVRHLARRILVKAGYQVTEASDAEEALMLHSTGMVDPQLLLTDVVMPGMNGRELAETLMERCPHLKVAYMSGYTDEVLVSFGATLQDIVLIEKPFTATILLQRVREKLDEGT